MKKRITPRSVFSAMVLIFSLAACGYLNHPSRLSIHLPVLEEKGAHFQSYEEAPARRNPLPDLQLLEKLIEAGKRIIPAH